MSDHIANLPLRSVIDEPAEPVLRGTVAVLAAILRVVTRTDWRGRDRIPSRGRAVFVVNHISYFDPLAYGHFLTWAGRWPRFLAKEQLFRVPGLGWIVRNAGQIPVRRGGPDAARSVDAAVAALRTGKSVSIYPEGTITTDPLGWPMMARTGAARIALAADAPVIPVGQWGAQHVIPGNKAGMPRLFPRRTMSVIAGEPVDLDDLRGRPLDEALLDEATDRIMVAITALVAELRGKTPPPGRWDPIVRERVEQGSGQ